MADKGKKGLGLLIVAHSKKRGDSKVGTAGSGQTEDQPPDSEHGTQDSLSPRKLQLMKHFHEAHGKGDHKAMGHALSAFMDAHGLEEEDEDGSESNDDEEDVEDQKGNK